MQPWWLRRCVNERAKSRARARNGVSTRADSLCLSYSSDPTLSSSLNPTSLKLDSAEWSDAPDRGVVAEAVDDANDSARERVCTPLWGASHV